MMRMRLWYLGAFTLTAGFGHVLGCGVADTQGDAEGDEGVVGEIQQAASSWDYPGPCSNEQTVPGTPQYLSADYHGLNPDSRVIYMPDVGRFRLGISCVGTAFIILRIGPDSAVCQQLGKCTPADLATLTPAQIDWVGAYYPAQLPLKHICNKHGFGWYDATGVAAGTYLAIAQSGSGAWGLVDGHGTMDTYAYYGNGGAYQPVNCPRPVVCGDGMCVSGENCASCEADCGACGNYTCLTGCGYDENRFCSCTPDCMQWGNCCPDACDVCGVCNSSCEFDYCPVY